MGNTPSGQNEWALILGGSSGFGLAKAHKLAEHGLNICVVHRDRRGAMSRIEPEFEKIRARGVALVTFNQDALADDARATSGAATLSGRLIRVNPAAIFASLSLSVPPSEPRLNRNARH